MKGFYQSSLGNKVDLRDIMNVSRNILRLFDILSTDNSDINVFLSLENPCIFLLAKERKSESAMQFSTFWFDV